MDPFLTSHTRMNSNKKQENIAPDYLSDIGLREQCQGINQRQKP